MRGQGAAPESTKSYDAFLSYCHEDVEAARALQRGLRRFAKPIWRVRALRVFRDETSLAASPEFWLELERAMLDSRFLIVLLSPAAAHSSWVSREIRAWTDSGRHEWLRLVLVDGELVWDGATGTFDPRLSDALSPSLVQSPDPTRNPPLYVDLRELPPAQMDLREPRFRAAILDLAADLHGRTKEELDGEDLREQRKLRRYRRLAVGGLVALTVAAVGAATFALVQARRATSEERRATAEADNARRQQALAEAGELAARSTAAQDPAVALMLAIAAEQHTPEPTQEALEAYVAAVQTYGQTAFRSVGDPVDVGNVELLDSSLAAGLVATGGLGELQLWNAETWDRVGVMDSQTDAVLAGRFSPDGAVIAVGGAGPLTVWDVATGRLVGGPFPVGDIYAIAWSPTGDRFLTGGPDGEIRVWGRAAARWTETSPPKQVPGTLEALAYSWDGSAVGIGGSDGVVVLDSGSLTPIGVAPADAGAVRDLAWSPDGRWVATVSMDGIGRLVRLDDGFDVPLRGSGSGLAWTVVWSNDGATVVTGDLSGEMRLWNAATGALIGDPVRAHRGDGAAVIALPDGQFLTSGGDGQLRRWSFAASGLARLLAADDGATPDVKWSPDSEAIMTASGQDSVRWFTAGRESVGERTFPVVSSGTDQLPSAQAVGWTDGGQGFLAASGDQLSRWTSGAETSWIVVLPTPGLDLAVREEQDDVIVAGDDGTIMIRRLADGAAVGDPLRGHGPGTDQFDSTHLRDIELRPDGRLLASAGSDATVRIWDLDRRMQVEVIDGAASSLAWSPDGAVLVIGGDDGTLRWWDTRSHSLVGEPVTAHSNPIAGAGFNGDGSVLATASEDGTLRYWDPKTQRAIGTPLPLQEGMASALSWSPDGQQLAVAMVTGGVRIWRTLPENQACQLATDALGDERVRETLGDVAVSCDDGGIAPGVPLVPAS